VPTARKVSTSDAADAVKVSFCACHGPTAPCGSENRLENWLSDPSDTCHCSVVGPVKPYCWPAAW
jgi:hypothetical protein